MAQKSYYEILKYPIATWIIFDIISFIAGFTNYVDISTQMLLGNGSIFIAMLFGIWVGKRASKAFNKLWVSMLSAVILLIIMGFVGVIASTGLSVWSQSFQVYTGQTGISSSSPVLNAAITIWFITAMVAIVGAALAHEFSGR